MTMVASGNPISLGGTTQLSGANESLEFELQSTYGTSGTAQISLNDSTVRTLAGISSGAISLGNFYGLSYYIGKLYAWGRNAAGQLGLGNSTIYSSPKQVGLLTNWLLISTSYSTSAAIKTDGTLWIWGGNGLGQLGLGNTSYYSSPVQIGALNNWAKISVTHSHALAIKTNGTLWSWGNNNAGQLGQNSITNLSSPKQIGALTNWLSVAAVYTYNRSGGTTPAGNTGFSLAIKTDGTLWGWGFNRDGELGLGNTVYYSSPKQVGSLTNWSNLATASEGGEYGFMIAVKTDGTLWGWGYNAQGQLGFGNRTTYYSSPKQIGALTNWLSVSCGSYFTSAIKTDGTLWAWGDNGDGNLGQNNILSYSSPKQVGALTNWLSVSCGSYKIAAIKTNGTLWTWGDGRNGQLGLGNLTAYSSPKQVGSSTNWIKVFSGSNQGSATLAITSS